MIRKRFLLVAGVDYDSFEIDFGALCKLRIEELISEHKGTAELHFLLYDFQRGTITTLIIPEFGPGKTESVDQRFNPITTKDYPGYKKGDYNILRNNITGAMSITDIYAAIIQMGINTPGELIEWSLFYLSYTHLVHSFPDDAVQGSKKAFNKLPKGSRDPEYLDIDYSYDFGPPRMSKDELQNLRKAFNPNGYAWIWPGGYSKTKSNDILIPFIQTPEIHDPSLPDEIFVKVNLDRKLIDEFGFYLHIAGTIPDKELEKLFDKKFRLKSDSFEVPLGSIREYICNTMDYHASTLAKSIRVKTYSTFDPFFVSFSKSNDQLPVVDTLDELTYSFLKKFLNIQDDKRKGYFAHFPERKKCKVSNFDAAIFKNKKYADDVKKLPPQKVVPRELTPLPKLTHPFFRLNEYTRHYVFITGVDYVNKGIDFREKALHRINALLKLNDHIDTTLFQILDFVSGKVIFCEVIYTDGLKKISGFDDSPHNHFAQVRFSVDDLTKFDAVKNDDSMYESGVDGMGNPLRHLREFNPRLMHMDFVYGRIIAIGDKAPGKLMELSFFTHGDESGPKTLNQLTREQIISAEQIKIKKMASAEAEKAVDQLEKKLLSYVCHDPEPNFKSKLFDDENRDFFLQAFHANAFTWCWGYEQNNDLRKLMKAMMESKEYAAPGLTDDTILTLKNPTPRIRLFAQRVAGLVSTKHSPPVKIKIPFGNLLYLFADIMKSSYMYHLAAFSGKSVIGPLPGINILSETESAFSLFTSDPLDKNFTAFYKAHFAIELDREKRGYAIYVNNFPWDASNLRGVRIEENIMEEIQKFPVE